LIKRRGGRGCPVERKQRGEILAPIDELTTAEWLELADLIIESPPARIHAAVTLVADWGAPADIPRLPTVIEWLLYLDDLSSSEAFDRAVLEELRRLSLH
jgi:hypothetical protein